MQGPAGQRPRLSMSIMQWRAWRSPLHPKAHEAGRVPWTSLTRRALRARTLNKMRQWCLGAAAHRPVRITPWRYSLYRRCSAGPRGAAAAASEVHGRRVKLFAAEPEREPGCEPAHPPPHARQTADSVCTIHSMSVLEGCTCATCCVCDRLLDSAQSRGAPPKPAPPP